MERTEVDSSQVRSVGYDSESQTLEVEFSAGGLYYYHGVPTEVFNGLMAAGSTGRFLASHVKGVYPFERVG